MRFSLLGPLAVDDGTGGGAVPGGARLRVLLAALVLRANTPVSREALAEAVWDGTPPLRAEVTLRTHVMRLRQALGPEAGARISVQDPGYMIRLVSSEVDVLEFDALCRETGRALRGADWESASQNGARALALWRGEPLLDVPSQSLRGEFVPRLGQLLVQVREDLIEAELRLGRHGRLVSQLRELTASYPLRERFHAQLMLALVRGGRRAEALEAYQDARRVLVDQLGIEPGFDLRDLHERILADKLEPLEPLDAPASADTAAPASPRQLPAAVRHFTGRETELDAFAALLGETDASGGTVVISAIDGMAGIGKTALAVRAAHRVADRFPDGQLFIDLHGYTQGYAPRSAGYALDRFLRALGVPAQQIPPDTDERAALYRQRLADTRTLILLDNAADEAQVRPLLPGSCGCLVLITSRRRLKGLDDAYPLRLDVLPPAEATALLRSVAGIERTSADDPAVLTEISELCGRLPLALRIAAALLRHRPGWSLDHLAGLLRDRRQRIRALSDGDRDLSVVLDLSYRTLGEQHQRLFRYLGLLPGPDTDAYAAAALTDTDPGTATRLLEDLVDQNVLISQASGRYQLHDLLRVHAAALAERDPRKERQAASDRLLDYYQHTAGCADARIARFSRPIAAELAPAHAPTLPDPDAARAWLRAERLNLLAAVQDATARADHRRIIALTAGLATLLRTDGDWAAAVALHTAAAAAAVELHDEADQARALSERAEAQYMTGDYAGAAHDQQEALFLFRRLEDRNGQAKALTELGRGRLATGDPAGAARDLQEALQLSRELDERNGQAMVLMLLGNMRRLIGDPAGATSDLQEALDLYRQLGERSGQATALHRLGDVRRVTGDYVGALRDQQEALQLFRSLRERNGEAHALTWLGDVRRLTGDPEGAARDLREALVIFRELGTRNGQAIALTWLGAARNASGDLEGAIRDLNTALNLFREIGARNNEAVTLNHYAAALAARGDRPQARSRYEEALRLARETGKLDEQGFALEGIGECDLHASDIEAGTAHLEQALGLFERLGMTPDVDRVQARLLAGTGGISDTPRHSSSE